MICKGKRRENTVEEKIKPELNGAAETMLQSFYARAQYSLSRKHKFYDAKAVEMVEKIDYEFNNGKRGNCKNDRI